MIAPTKPSQSKHTVPVWHQPFLAMLPAIRRHARFALRGLSGEALEDAVQEVLVSAMVAYARLYALGKVGLAYPSVLARYGVAQYKAGRRVGSKLNVRDVTSPHCQLAKGIRVGRLDHRDEDTGRWKEILIEDRRAGPAEVAASRIDFGEWLSRLSARRRHIAEVLATGETTKTVARQFRLSPARVSQIRRELMERWDEFQSEARGTLAVA